MYNIAKASEQDRRVLFRNTAQQTGLHEAIIEKDFWVCLDTGPPLPSQSLEGGLHIQRRHQSLQMLWVDPAFFRRY